MIYMFLADGFEEIEALCPLDLLLRAEIDIKTVSVTGNLVVNGAHNIKVIADTLLEELDSTVSPEMVILPGGKVGAFTLNDNETVKKYILDTNNKGGYIAAICAAPMVLGNLGLLNCKNAICYPGFESYLTGAVISEEKVVCDGNIITGKGMGVSQQFGLKLIEILKSEDMANKIKESIMA
jgi:DJ-1 family protein